MNHLNLWMAYFHMWANIHIPLFLLLFSGNTLLWLISAFLLVIVGNLLILFLVRKHFTNLLYKRLYLNFHSWKVLRRTKWSNYQFPLVFHSTHLCWICVSSVSFKLSLNQRGPWLNTVKGWVPFYVVLILSS